INFPALRLKVRSAIAFGRAGGVAGKRAFVPIKPQPTEAVENDIDGGLSVAGGIRVFNAQDERAAGVTGVKPVEQSGARAADVEVASWRRCETNPGFHVH